ncbi:MAG: hypothetical protein ACR2QW_12090 [bacterium]
MTKLCNLSHPKWDSSRLLVFPVFLFMLVCKPVSAYVWDSDYGANITVGFDDNFRLGSDDEIDTASTSVGVFTDIDGRTEISNIRLALGIDGTTYSESSIDDQTSYNLSLDTSRSAERLSSSLSVAFVSAATTETELLDTGFLEEDGTRDSISVSPGLSYQVNERISVSASLGFQDVSYDTVSLTEYTDNSLSLSWRYQLDETSSISISLRHAVYDPDNDDDTDTNSLSVGYALRASEATTYNFSVGFTEVERPDDTEDGNNYAFDVNRRIDERNSFVLGLSNSFESSGEGFVREEDTLNLQWNHSISGRAQVTISAEGVKSDDRDYYSFAVGSNYQYSREIGLSASYRYREQDEGQDTADSSSVFFSLVYAPI